MQDFPVGPYDRDPRDRYKAVDLDHLETEGPRRWGFVPAGALQQRFYFGIGALLIRVIAGPYVLVIRSAMSRWLKLLVLAGLGALYALAFALCMAIPPPR